VNDIISIKIIWTFTVSNLFLNNEANASIYKQLTTFTSFFSA